jgi:hypothetical protein
MRNAFPECYLYVPGLIVILFFIEFHGILDEEKTLHRLHGKNSERHKCQHACNTG